MPESEFKYPESTTAVGKFYGFYFKDIDPKKCWEIKCWVIKCPCGVTVELPLNGIPEVDTPHPCGNPDHWLVKYENRGAK